MSGKSPELEAILSRWVEATAKGNGAVVRNLLSRDPAALYCGTGADEVITGQTLQNGITAHIEEITNAVIEDVTIHSHAWEESGWAIAQCRVRNLESQSSLLWRLSVFFRLENGQWNAHHAHGSYATDFHETRIGVRHSAFQDLLNAVVDMDLQIESASSATVMFTDILGSTSLNEALGDKRWTTCVREHVNQVSSLVQTENGRVIKSLGDGTMSTFPSAGAALRAAQTIQRLLATQTAEPRLRVRIGLHTGDVIEAGDDFFGTVVSKAARIADAAGPEEILASDATRVMVGGARDFAFANSTELHLKGLDGSHVVHRLDWAQ